MASRDEIRAATTRAFRRGQEDMRARAEDAARIVAVTRGARAGERAKGIAEGALAAEKAIRALPIHDWDDD